MRSLQQARPAEQAAAPNALALSFAARLLANRYGIPQHRAVLIAELAGFAVQLESVALSNRGV